MDRREIQTILSAAGLAPQQRYGQNFMVDQNILKAIAEAGEIQPGDVVLEVGPGVGNLTRQLSERVGPQGWVVAVDIDKRLLAASQRHHAALGNVVWLQGDVLAGKHELNPEVLAKLDELRTPAAGTGPRRGIKLVSNLPYNAASPLVAELLVWCVEQQGSRGLVDPSRDRKGATPDPQDQYGSLPDGRGSDSPLPPPAVARLAFTVQWEVAQRLTAKPDTSDYGPLGVLIQLAADVEIVRKIPPGAFWPPPKVNSGLVVIIPQAEKLARIKDAVSLQRLLAGLFGHRRQKLLNGLKHYLGEQFENGLADRITAAGIDLTLRPEALEPEAFLTMTALVGTVVK